MGKLLNKAQQIKKDFGYTVFLKRTIEYGIFKTKRWIYPKDKNNLANCEAIHNIHKGKRIFILGNGPSLNEMPLYLLKDEYKMCFNHFNLMSERVNWFPQFFAITDDLVFRDMASTLDEEIIPKTEWSFFPDIHTSNINFKKRIKSRDNVIWLHVDKSEFSDKLPACGIIESCVNAGIQAAAWMGFTEIYIIGVDLTFFDKPQSVNKSNSRDLQATEDDPNHFDPRYFGKGKHFHLTPQRGQKEGFKIAREFFGERGVKIYNAGYGGKLDVLERVDFCSILSMSDQKKETLFKEAIMSVGGNSNLTSYTIGVKTDGNFKVSETEGIKIIKNMIKSHIPLGPFGQEYYFVKREKDLIF